MRDAGIHVHVYEVRAAGRVDASSKVGLVWTSVFRNRVCDCVRQGVSAPSPQLKLPTELDRGTYVHRALDVRWSGGVFGETVEARGKVSMLRMTCMWCDGRKIGARHARYARDLERASQAVFNCSRCSCAVALPRGCSRWLVRKKNPCVRQSSLIRAQMHRYVQRSAPSAPVP
jgi:hypothetical protein